MANIIAIAGKDGVGKSTLAGSLAHRMGDTALIAFATSLRQMCVDYAILTYDEAWSKPTPPEVRKILREYSLSFKSYLGDTIFAFNTLKTISRCLNAGIYTVIIHDMRFAVELKALREEFSHSSDRLYVIYVGSDELSQSEAEMPSFADLPQISQEADIRLPQYPSFSHVEYLVQELI